jgi:hypothetical protein
MKEPAELIEYIARLFEQLGITYVLGGSWASSMHGITRATMDADFLADIREEHVAEFIVAIKDDFYFDEGAIREAIRIRRSFNIIHLTELFKIDIFVRRHRRFDTVQLQRGHQEHLTPDIMVNTTSKEDILLAKLDWYREGGEVSEQQWRDILGLLRVNQDTLDSDYLTAMAEDLGVTDLLHRALTQTEPLRGQ